MGTEASLTERVIFYFVHCFGSSNLHGSHQNYRVSARRMFLAFIESSASAITWSPRGALTRHRDKHAPGMNRNKPPETIECLCNGASGQFIRGVKPITLSNTVHECDTAVHYPVQGSEGRTESGLLVPLTLKAERFQRLFPTCSRLFICSAAKTCDTAHVCLSRNPSLKWFSTWSKRLWVRM